VYFGGGLPGGFDQFTNIRKLIEVMGGIGFGRLDLGFRKVVGAF
jgi:hypothetical protein